MKNVNATLGYLVVMTTLTVPALATQAPTPAPPPSPSPAPVRQSPTQDDRQPPQLDMRAMTPDEKTTAKGRLSRVDSDLMTIVIKDADGEEQEFRYTDATKVVGAQEQVSGLSTRAGALVTIHFIQGAGENRIATKVHFDDEKP